MTTDEVADALESFESAALKIASMRVRVRRGPPSADDVRRHAARTAAQFYFATVWKRTERAALPGDGPVPPILTRRTSSRHQDGERE